MGLRELHKIPEDWRIVILSQVKEACEKLSIKEATLGDKILANPGIFPDLRNGKSCKVDTLARLITWFSDVLPNIQVPSVTKKQRSFTPTVAKKSTQNPKKIKSPRGKQ